MALVEKALGNLAEARRLMKNAYEIRLNRLGEDHPYTIGSARWLAENEEK